MSTVSVTVQGARGESFADVARRVGSIGDIAISEGASDADVLAALQVGLGSALALTVAAAGHFYADTAAGIAATANNGYFWIPGTGDTAAIGYKNNSGSAVEVARVASKGYADTAMRATGANAAMTDDQAAGFRRAAQSAFYDQGPVPTLTAGFFFGNSITYGSDASPRAADRWSTLLSTVLGITEDNFGASGNVVADQAYAAFAQVSSDHQLSPIELGTNDTNWYLGGDEDAKRWLGAEGHLAIILDRAMPDASPNKVLGRAATTNAGPWTNLTDGEDRGGTYTTTINAEKQATVTGSTVGVTVSAYDAPLGGECTVEIDGVVHGPFALQTQAIVGEAIATEAGHTDIPVPLIFDGLEDRPHVVKVKKTDATDSNKIVALRNIMGFNGQPIAGAVVPVANTYDRGDGAGVGWHGVGDESDAAAAAAKARAKLYNRAWARNVAIANRLGLRRVLFWDWASVIDPTTDLDATDKLHPTNGGHAKLAASGQVLIENFTAGYQQVLPPDIVALAGMSRNGFAPLNNTMLVVDGEQIRSGRPDDVPVYEEGTFTPTLTIGGASTGIAYTTRLGRYRKIGGIVFFTIVIVLSSKGSATGAVKFTGLPFTSDAAPSTYGMVLANNVSSVGCAQAIVDAEAETVSLFNFSSSTLNSLTNSNLSDTSTLTCSMFYAI